jgi:uncharacterized protein YjbJ (UPF0337 family)
MDEDQIAGAGRTKPGEAEESIGSAIGSERLEGDGVFNQFAGNVQHGYGKAKEAVSDIIDDVPAAVDQMANRSRDLLHDADSAVRRKLGGNGPLYVLAGAVGFLGLALFAVARANQHMTPARKTKAAGARTHVAAAKDG